MYSCVGCGAYFLSNPLNVLLHILLSHHQPTPPLISSPPSHFPTQLCFQRAAWDTPYQLVGHLGPVVCARFSPRLYYKLNPDGSVDKEEAGVCVALGGTDGVVSVWLLNNTRAVMAGRKVWGGY